MNEFITSPCPYCKEMPTIVKSLIKKRLDNENLLRTEDIFTEIFCKECGIGVDAHLEDSMNLLDCLCFEMVVRKWNDRCKEELKKEKPE